MLSISSILFGRPVRQSNLLIASPLIMPGGFTLVQVMAQGRADRAILHLPGELFVEYQLAAKAIRPDLFVATAAYGDYAPWYIGTEVTYRQGDYETGPDASNVAPEVEVVLMAAIRKLRSSADP